MPKSRVRKKKGKKVSGRGARITVDPNKESSITLQDLINVVAYQEAKAGNYEPPEHEEAGEAGEIYAKIRSTTDDTEIAPGVILRADAIVNIPGTMEVVLENERGEKVGIGTASRIEGDSEHVSIHITDPNILRMVSVPDNFSIDKEQTE